MGDRLQHCFKVLRKVFVTLVAIPLVASVSVAQTQQGALTLPNSSANITDTSAYNKSNTDDWHNNNVRITYKKLGSEKEYTPDSSIHTFHRRSFLQPWYQDLGNQGSPTRNLLFTPEDRMGPTLGYHVYDVYRFNKDSLNYYNTNRPYSEFGFQLGSKLEQKANILHTQNVKPNWNIAVQYRKTTSPGFYLIQRTNHDNAYLSTHYQSVDKHYDLYAAFIYNKEQQDENGGIVDESQLTNSRYNDRRTVDVAFRNDTYGASGSVRRSSVTNTQRDYTILLHHGYTFGKDDTTYNEDSTKMHVKLIPRFGIAHHFELSSEKYVFKDVRPDSLRYTPFFNYSFAGTDSVFMQQNWMKIDNKLLLNGFLGKSDAPLQFTAGIGNRFDNFTTEYIIGNETQNITSLYLTGGIKKEALEEKQWFYEANATLYFAGSASGNSTLQAVLGRDLGKDLGSISIGAQQSVNNAPYNYTTYINQYDTIKAALNNESVTTIFGQFNSDKLKLGGGIRSYLIQNYIYLNDRNMFDQYAPSFNITQVWVRKALTWRNIVLDNEFVYQQPTSGAVVNIPKFMGRHQLSYERYIFKSALKIATGVQVRYASPYTPAGYNPFFNRYYYQTAYTVDDQVQGAVFFNFKVKRFRAYIMGDQIQRLFMNNMKLAEGYTVQNTMIRFGFNWILIN